MIDTKGWAGWGGRTAWACTGMYHYYQQTGDQTMRKIVMTGFADRFAEGATKNVNTMARRFLTLAYRYEETRNPARIYRGCKRGGPEMGVNEMPPYRHGGMQHITLAEKIISSVGRHANDDGAAAGEIGKLLNRPEYGGRGNLSVPAARAGDG